MEGFSQCSLLGLFEGNARRRKVRSMPEAYVKEHKDDAQDDVAVPDEIVQASLDIDVRLREDFTGSVEPSDQKN